MALDRQQAVKLLAAYLPKEGYIRQGQVGFDHIAKDYGGGGTTCGFLPHWLLWRLGASDAALVNRYEPDSSFLYENGANLTRIFSSSAFVRLDRKENRQQFLNRTIEPKPGDTVFISGGKKQSKDGKSFYYDEHVYVVLGQASGAPDSKLTWRIAQTGQTVSGKQAGHITDRGVNFQGSTRGGGAWTDGKWTDTEDGREVLGWLDLDGVAFGKLPSPSVWDPLAAHSLESNAGPPLPDKLAGVWRISRWSVSYYMFYKGHRVFRVRSDSPSQIVDAGMWFHQSGDIIVYWESFLRDRLTIQGETGEGEDDFGPYAAAKTLTTHEVMQTYKDSHGQPVNDKVRGQSAKRR